MQYITTFFPQRTRRTRAKSISTIHFDIQTKIDILMESIKEYNEMNASENTIDKMEYIQKILQDLKKDFTHDDAKIQLLDELNSYLQLGNFTSAKKIVSRL